MRENYDEIMQQREAVERVDKLEKELDKEKLTVKELKAEIEAYRKELIERNKELSELKEKIYTKEDYNALSALKKQLKKDNLSEIYDEFLKLKIEYEKRYSEKEAELAEEKRKRLEAEAQNATLQQKVNKERNRAKRLLAVAKQLRRRQKQQVATDKEILNAIKQSYEEELRNTQDEKRKAELQNRIDNLEKDADIADQVEKILTDSKKFVEKIAELEKVVENATLKHIQPDERNETYKQFVYNYYKQQDYAISELFDAIRMSDSMEDFVVAFNRNIFRLKDEYLSDEFYAILCDFVRDNYDNYDNERDQIEAFLTKKAEKFNADAKFDTQFEQMQKTDTSEKTLISDTNTHTNTRKI